MNAKAPRTPRKREKEDRSSGAVEESLSTLDNGRS
jgi:hypothetical protein